MAGGSDNTRRPAGAGASDTIGLFGGSRSSASAQFGSTRSSRYRRLGQIVEIVSHYDVARGLTPEGLRLMLQELGPTFVKAGQILSMRSEILPQSFCDELSKLRTNVEPMPYETVLAALREEYDRPLEEIFDAIEPEPVDLITRLLAAFEIRLPVYICTFLRVLRLIGHKPLALFRA